MYPARMPLLLITLGLVACATPAPPAGRAAVGIVQALYVEVAPDIYVSQKLFQQTPARDYWVAVAVNPAPLGAATTMAIVPATLSLSAGDAVTIILAPPARHDNERPLEHNRVIGILADAGAVAASRHPDADVLDRYLIQLTATRP